MGAANLHGTAVVLGDRGVLITGRSGAGKTALALCLVDLARARGHFARLVADDQLLLAARRGRLVVTAPASIAGLVEVYGLGPTPVAWEGCAVIDLIVRLVEAPAAPRFQEGAEEIVAGIHLPSISLAERNATAAASAVMARLRL